ncbi:MULTISPECIES: ABC transporter permease [Anaerococcus]|uniref:Glutathione transport system permease protein GsiC n=2 Tax=Anaerococcus TaxID=165779 RepID=A0A6N2S1J9_9FIRM|nr:MULTISPECIES: ABC transporter permease subunit [Anaerococcus]MBS4889894.1 ABC transporter permease [Anaerococcus vaginalis]MBS6921640.1 ABC transporter permease [Anaerococcus vaginalis]MDU0945557.1 ABC transporter permease [Anaerococcus vaginalis]MDU1030518.1 ABC transporter permease [Anaerococcus vaginalis]MDU1707200.1 ABC transporter permease [Anaerococcus vaginalis]
MLKYIVKRIINLIPVAIIISILVFVLSKSMPGDPVLAMMPKDGRMTKAQQEQMYKNLEKRYGYDKSLPEQYFMWMGRSLKGDFGESTQAKRPVKEYLSEPLKNTILLNIGSTLVSFVLSVLIGIRSAVHKGGFFDKFFQVFTLVGISLPTFFIGLFLIFLFAFRLGWFPANGMPRNNTFGEWVKYLILPTLTLTFGSMASISRYVRNSMLDSLNEDYIRTARAKGLKEKTVIYSHAFRNALIPVVTAMTWAVLSMFSGSAITETIFAYRGIGNILIKSVLAQDYNVILALTMFYAILTLLGNLIMDIAYALVDPRVKLEA